MSSTIDMDKWYELPIHFREEVVNYLQNELPSNFFEGLREAYNDAPETWWAGMWHFSQGMQMRNILREGGFADDQLPSGNWDDYYIQALEVAAGLHEVAT